MQERTAFLWMFYVGIVFLTLVCERIESTRSGLTVARMQRELKLKEAKNDHVRFQLDELKSPAQLELAARSRGMMEPEPRATAILGDLPQKKDTAKWVAKLYSPKR